MQGDCRGESAPGSKILAHLYGDEPKELHAALGLVLRTVSVSIWIVREAVMSIGKCPRSQEGYVPEWGHFRA
jgi:hypothetical protein